MARRYDKLVRDRIPAIIEASGDRPLTHVAGDEEYQRRLREKLLEECQEYHEDPSLEELADVLAVIEACLDHHGWTREALEAERRRKRAERGGFEDRIVLEAVQEGSDTSLS